MSSRRRRCVFSLLVLLASICPPAAVSRAAEEIARMQARRVDCLNMPAGNMACEQFIHLLTLTSPTETRAGQTFLVYTKGEIDEQLKTLKSSLIEPQIQALVAEVARLRRSLTEMRATCAEASYFSPR
jgi:hypothetical protein